MHLATTMQPEVRCVKKNTRHNARFLGTGASTSKAGLHRTDTGPESKPRNTAISTCHLGRPVGRAGRTQACQHNGSGTVPPLHALADSPAAWHSHIIMRSCCCAAKNPLMQAQASTSLSVAVDVSLCVVLNTLNTSSPWCTSHSSACPACSCPRCAASCHSPCCSRSLRRPAQTLCRQRQHPHPWASCGSWQGSSEWTAGSSVSAERCCWCWNRDQATQSHLHHAHCQAPAAAAQHHHQQCLHPASCACDESLRQ